MLRSMFVSYQFAYHDLPRKHNKEKGTGGTYNSIVVEEQFRVNQGERDLETSAEPLPEGCVARIHSPCLGLTCIIIFSPGAKADGDYWLGTEST